MQLPFFYIYLFACVCVPANGEIPFFIYTADWNVSFTSQLKKMVKISVIDNTKPAMLDLH